MTNVSEADAINPDALKYYRKKAGYQTQAALAEAIRCTTDEVNRWENRKIKKPRRHLMKQLTEALNVEWDKLTQPPPKEDAAASFEASIQLNRKVRPSTRTAMELVSARYDVSWRNILELAPLTFAILAEQSLQARKQTLDDAWAKINEATESADNALSYIPGGFVEYYINQSLIDEEEASVKRREVFKSYYDGRKELSPFADHLKKLTQELADFDVDIELGLLDTPEYRFADKHIEELTGLTGDNRQDRDIVALIQEHYLDLHEVLAMKTKLGATEYRDWLESRYAEADNARRKERDEFDEFLGSLGAPDSHNGEKTAKQEGLG